MAIDTLILIGSILLIFSILIFKTGYRFGAPVLLLFLFIGIIAGKDCLNLITFDSPDMAQIIGLISLNIILFSGGMDTRMQDIRPIIAPGIILATFGVFLTAIFTGLFIYWICGSIEGAVVFSLVESLLLASIMASTDSASVFAILRSKGLSLRENLRPLLELESGSNDPMAYLMTIVLIQLIGSNVSALSVLSNFLFQLVFGLLCGVLIGKLAVKLINRIELDNDALYSVLLLSVMLFIYGFSNFIGGNGYLAVYVGGLMIGNSRFVHKQSSLRFFDGLTWLFQIIMFLALGLLVSPTEMIPVIGIGLIVGLFMIIVARPLATFICLAPFRRFSLKGRLFVSFVGLRGAVPIVFATYPWINNVPYAKTIFNIVFFITLLSLAIQGTQITRFAKWLKLSLPQQRRIPLREFDVEFSDDIREGAREQRVTAEMLANGNRLMDMDIDEHTLVAMVKRKNDCFIPKGNTIIKENDIMLLLSDNQNVDK